ncbi:hypothetical protein AGMMS49545_21310 [Betaproteobacteria bacterium]|nr:hypothetical protein FACS1894101_1130 [Betaproteobacteria bacterium]GHT96418.1 hypothetical protein AGMMS49545_21310 [Betaproteobacteria bacterium]GHU47966.1 hypothetical protein AGMMS50289_23930 [Betaproteobacteria bacterium]
MKTALIVFALVVLALALPFFMPAQKPPENVAINLPWQIAVDEAGNSEVFGLTPGKSALADARQRFGNDFEVAIIAAPNEAGALEAYYDRIFMGQIQGRLILTLDASETDIAAMRQRAVKRAYMESSTRKITLHPDDTAQAEHTAIRAITLIPGASLDEGIIIERFGKAAEILPEGENLTHYLYPQKGLEIVHDKKGKEILHYVAPAKFDEQIRMPLEKAVAARGKE